MHPWEYRRYTLRDLFFKVDALARKNESTSKRLTEEIKGQWNRTRWLATVMANIGGAKLKSVYQLTRFSWDEPEPSPGAGENWLNKFPKSIESASNNSKT